jgi:hypothetical protein
LSRLPTPAPAERNALVQKHLQKLPRLVEGRNKIMILHIGRLDSVK